MRPTQIEKKNNSNKEAELLEIPEELVFWVEVFNKQKKLESIKINYVRLCKCLMDLGFVRFDLDMKTLTYIQIKERIVSEVNRNKIIDQFIDHVRTFSKYDIGYAEVEDIETKLYGNLGSYFKEDILNRLVMKEKIEFVQDTADAMFFPFKNGLAKVTKTGLELIPFSKVTAHIWEKQIIDFELKPTFKSPKEGEDYDIETKGMFAKFVQNIAGKSEKRFFALCTIIGYNLHYYFDSKRKATVFTDSEISENPEGRTGKTLLGKAIQKVRNTTEINGKDFNSEDRFRWQEVEISTQIAILNDLRRGFFLENLFNDITEGIGVQYKGNRSFKHNAKIIINTNQTIKIEGGSSKDRVIQYELSSHYSKDYSPADEFKCWFFRDWDATEWNHFYNFMLFCGFSYLKYGIIEPETINLAKRTLTDHTNKDFLSWIENEGKSWLESGEQLVLQDLFANYKTLYPDSNWEKFRTQNFSRFLNTYAESVGKKWEKKRSNGKDLIQLI